MAIEGGVLADWHRTYYAHIANQLQSTIKNLANNLFVTI
jgi:hypothetical protein